MEKIILIIAVAFVCAVMFAGFITAMVACHDAAKAKRAVKAKEPVTVSDEEPAAAETVATSNEEDKPESDVNFSTDKLTLEEKYLKLPAETRAYYDDIVCYAMSIEGHKRYKKAAYEEYKIGKNSLVKIKIKNDVIVCELLVPNLDFKNYVSDNKIDVRQAATVIRVTDEASLEAVKGSMNIVLKEFEKEREYKKEKAKMRRRERRAQTKNVNATENAEVKENNVSSENN